MPDQAPAGSFICRIDAVLESSPAGVLLAGGITAVDRAPDRAFIGLPLTVAIRSAAGAGPARGHPGMGPTGRLELHPADIDLPAELELTLYAGPADLARLAGALAGIPPACLRCAYTLTPPPAVRLRAGRAGHYRWVTEVALYQA